MTHYFGLPDVLRSGAKQDPLAQSVLVRIFPDAAAARVESSSLLVSSEEFNLLDFNAPFAAERFAPLLGDVQIYRLSLELILDEALLAAQDNQSLHARLLESFGPRGLPTMTGHAEMPVDPTSGDLRHPLLAHLPDLDLARVFVKFLTIENSDVRQRPYGLHELIALNRKPFCDHFDGYALNGAKYARLDKLLRTARRPDHDPAVPLEFYMQRGQKMAQASAAQTTPEDLLKAWLRSDLFQSHRCEAVDQVLSRGFKMPPWARADIFSVLEHEAMKQIFAQRFLEHASGRKMVAHCPLLSAALEAGAQGDVDEKLEMLLKETIGRDAPYAGAGEKFAQDVRHRLLEAELGPGLA